ncbi:MAG: hypothetical protein HY046_02135 [Acidobacteria bacterium]|nr:hypothetical protein [Acidobacteriota bacterium]
MRPVSRWPGILAACLCACLFGASASADTTTTKAKSKSKSAKKAADKTAGKSSGKSSPSEATPAPQGPRGAQVATKNTPTYMPIPATIGTLGLFTMDTGVTLPKKNFGLAGYVNKFSRKPGGVSIVNWGWTVSTGLTDKWTAFFQWEPHRHVHVGDPTQLSFRSALANPQFGSTIYRSLTAVPGIAPGYVEDYPFAGVKNTGGPGEVTIGVQYGWLSEWRGDPVNLSFRSDFIIPTRTELTNLLGDGSQSGQFNYGIGAALSKTWASKVQGVLNWGYRFTRDPRNSSGARLLTQADQMKFGVGFLLFPEKKLQFINEYTSTIFTGSSTPNTSFGARDPVDGVWGIRWYPYKNFGVDLGYRHMLNINSQNDPNGFVMKVGWLAGLKEKPQPILNRAPSAACSASRSSVYAASGDTINISAQASDPDNDTLTYSWNTSGGRIEGSGSSVRWNSSGAAVGNYTVTARVDDGHGGSASCAADVKVEPRPNRPPTLSCAADRSSVFTGERIRISGTGADPDNDTLTYAWRTNGGKIVGSGDSVTLDTSDLAPGRYSVTGRVDDGRGGAADCSVGVEVKQPPATPVAAKLNECFFRASSARVDNVCKRILDDVALRLQNDPKARVVLVGYGDPKENKKIANQRAAEAQKYLGGKGIAASRSDLREAGGKAGETKQNRRLDVIWVPEGASY